VDAGTPREHARVGVQLGSSLSARGAKSIARSRRRRLLPAEFGTPNSGPRPPGPFARCELR
jgi:hypothetical protein